MCLFLPTKGIYYYFYFLSVWGGNRHPPKSLHFGRIKLNRATFSKRVNFANFTALSSQYQDFNRPCCLNPSPTLRFFWNCIVRRWVLVHFNSVQLNGAMHWKCNAYPTLGWWGGCIPIFPNGGSVPGHAAPNTALVHFSFHLQGDSLCSQGGFKLFKLVPSCTVTKI
jgi:hypothetical protein